MASLFDALNGVVRPQMPAQSHSMGNAQGPDWNALMSRLQANPGEMIKGAGYNVPDEIASNPQAAVMHLIQSGQVGGPMMQRIRPMLQQMGMR